MKPKAKLHGVRIGILGSGLRGGKSGTIFARTGRDVVFSYARSNDKLTRLARDAPGHARPVLRARLRRKRTQSSWPCIGPESTMC
jgi:hypothetical protein